MKSLPTFRTCISSLLMAMLILLSTSMMAQETADYGVRGVIKDSNTGESLPFANVFFAGTTFGTTSDQEGIFTLKTDGPGTYNLVISFMGFKPYKRQVVLNQPGILNLTIDMQPEPRFIGEVTVTAKKDRQWKKLLKTFKGIFLGTSENARNCKILNEDILFLDMDNRTQIFEAYAGEPLIIENEALGYKITYVLESFKINYAEGYFDFSGFPSYEEMEGNERQEERWLQRRDHAYFGSMEHFLRALYKGKSYAAGFRVQRGKNTGSIRTLEREDFLVDNEVSTSADGVRKELTFDNYIYVRYLGQKPDRYYAASLPANAPANIKYSNNQLSWFQMPIGENKLVFEKSGFWVNPQAFIMEGYWNFMKMADLLPVNYKPSNQF